jgi:hypothetical protein
VATIVGTRQLEQLTYLTTPQAAELLQCSEEHIRKGTLPGAQKVLGVTRRGTPCYWLT